MTSATMWFVVSFAGALQPVSTRVLLERQAFQRQADIGESWETLRKSKKRPDAATRC